MVTQITRMRMAADAACERCGLIPEMRWGVLECGCGWGNAVEPEA